MKRMETIESITDFIIADATDKTYSGNWITSPGDIPADIAPPSFVQDNLEAITDVLGQREEVLDMEVQDGKWDIVYGLAFCPNHECGEEDLGESDAQAYFSIYQLKEGDELRDYRFERLDRLEARGFAVDQQNYNHVYTGAMGDNDTLDSIYERFNIDHPADFRGHSLSVSDIVVLRRGDDTTAHYVDSFGFRKLPDFFQEKASPEKVAEKKPSLMAQLRERQKRIAQNSSERKVDKVPKRNHRNHER